MKTRSISATAMLLLAALPCSADIAQQAYLKAAVPHASDNFGHAMALDGDTLVAGAPAEDGSSGNDEGAVYVFVRQDGAWVQQAKLKANNPGAGDLFGLSVSLSGNTLVVGAQNEDSNDSGINHTLGGGADNLEADSGAAYVFVRSGGTWTQQAYLKSSSPDPGDLFGVSVGISGETVVVGARDDDGLATNAGAAYLFVRSGSTWSQQQIVRASNGGSSNRFGASVAISGNTIVAGAYGHDGGINNAGAAYVFFRSGTTWSQQAYLLATNRGDSDLFGLSVAISGETIVVGARDEDSNATGVGGSGANNSAVDSGAAYVFTRSGTSWGAPTYLKASNTGAGDQFSEALAIHGDTIVVGSMGEDSNATGINGNPADNSAPAAGAAYVYKRSGGTWSQLSYLKASNTGADDGFGSYRGMLAVSGDLVACGAVREDSGAAGVNGNEGLNNLTDAGAVYLYDFATPPLAPVFGSAEDKGWSGFDPTLTPRTFAGATLNFAPAPGTTLTLVEKRGLGFLSGTFSNLAQGQKVTLGYNGQDYNFIANYYGRSGNDLVLQWAGAVPRSWGSQDFDVANFDLPFQKIAAGGYHTVALRQDGSVVAWGYNNVGQVTVPTSAKSEVTSIAAGPYSTLALKQDGRVVAWGSDSQGLMTVPTAAHSGVSAIATGGGHAMALKQDGSIVAWGYNGFGLTTVPIAAQSLVTAIAAGQHHNVALKQDGSVVAWGDNAQGQTTVPTAAQSGVTIIAAGQYHTVALKQDGSVVAWGSNAQGQTTVPAAAQSGVVGIAAGGSHTVALKQDGSIVAWGDGNSGQTTVPTAAQSGVVGIAAGYSHTVALKQDGSVVAWGDNTSGQTTVPTAAQSGVVGIAAGNYHTVALRQDGSVAAWGYNGFGQTTVPAAAQSGVVGVAAGDSHTVALRQDGSVVAWGYNGSGQTTVPAAAQSGVVGIAAGSFHTVALKQDGSVVAWGHNIHGQTTVPTAAQSGVVGIAAGYYHTVALKQDGSVVAWGNNNSGQTTVPTAAQSGVVDIAAGIGHTVALKQDGSVVAWGNNDFGQTTVPTAVQSGVVGIAAGIYHTVALRLDGSVGAWGYNGSGQTTVPAAAQSGVVGIAAGSYHTVALVSQKPRLGLTTASGLSASSVAIQGRTKPGGQPTILTVEYGTNTSYGNTVAIPLPEDDGTDFIDASVTLTGLTPGTAYHYRLVAASVVGTTTSADGTFTTLPAPTLDPSWTSAGSVAVTAAGYTASGMAFGTPVLSFAPAPGTTLTVVKNTGLGFIVGEYGDLAQGQKVALQYNGTAYNFIANYHGGNGNDLVLQWAGLVPRVWGGQTFNPEDFNRPFVQATAGWGHTVALKADGSVVAWGGNEYGQTTIPAGAQSGVTAIAAGEHHTVALKTDGSVIAWGGNSSGQATIPPAALSGVASIVAGQYHTAALKTDGSVVAWGHNGSGQTTVPAEAQSGVAAIAAGLQHMVALKGDGSVVAWGHNGSGQTTVPEGLTGVTAIAAGRGHTVALKQDGSVVVWGDNAHGQATVPMEAQSGIAAVAAGEHHTVALKIDGSIVAWGGNPYGQTAVPAAAQSGVAAIGSGYFHTVALKTDGSVVAWGRNDHGESMTPARLTGIAAIAAGEYHTVALNHNGGVVAWGNSIPGQTQVPEAALSGVAAIDAGEYHTVALKTEGGTVAWGLNDDGQTAVPGAAQSGVVSIAAGGAHTVALSQDGSIVAWGGNSYGQTTVPGPAQAGVAAVAAGAGHTVALKQNGSVVTWGFNSSGLTTVPGSAQSGITAIAAGYAHTLALKQDGSVIAWGRNVEGQTTVPGGLTGVTAIDAGHFHAVALKTDGSVLAWGNNDYGQAVAPAGLAGVASIAAGGWHTVALVPLKPCLGLSSASGITSTAALIHGSTNPNGQPTTLTVEYGPDTNYGSTAMIPLPVNDGPDFTEGSVTLPGLTPGTTYHYRLAATSVVGTTTSEDATFTTGGQPEIAVSGNAVGITSGDNTPSDSDHTDFGAGSQVRTFTVANPGTASLTLSGAPAVTLSGSGAFHVSQQPASTTLAANGGTTTFSISFVPTTAGLHTANVSIASNDPDENPFTFVITGTGLATGPSVTHLLVADGATRSVVRLNAASGDSEPFIGSSGFVGTPYCLVIGPDGLLYVLETDWNTGGATRVLKFDAHTGAFIGPFIPGGISRGTAGVFDSTGNFYVARDVSPFVLKFNASGEPVGSLIPAATYSPDTAVGNAFGLGIGPDGLLYLSVADTVGNAADIARFDLNGNYVDTFVNNVGDANGYRFPQWDSQGNLWMSNLNDGVLRKFNGATGALMQTINPPSNGYAGWSFLPDGGLVVGSVWNNTIYRVQADGGLVGTFAPSVQANSMIPQPPAAPPMPAITLFDGLDSSGAALSNNQTSPVDFGSHPLPIVGGVTRSFTVKNSGTAPLAISSISVTPIGTFELQAPPSATLAPDASFTFTIRFSSNVAGSSPGSISILSNAPDHPTFAFPIAAAALDVTPPVVQVSMGGMGSNLSYPGYLKAGAMISLNILSNEPVQPPVVQICGRPAIVGESFGGTSWFAHVTVDETFPQGPAGISVTATDLAGNSANPVTSPSSGTPVTVDTIAPAIVSSWISSSNPAGAWAKAGDTVYAGFTMSEEILNPSFTVFGTPWMGTVMSSPGSVSIISNPISFEPEGPVAVSFQCVDRAGNSADFNPVSFSPPVVVDRTPPIITQGDLTAELTGPSGTAVAFSPTATDALGAIVSVVSSPPSGSFFAPGTTPISVSAMDSAGNTGSGNFDLTMLEAGDFWRDTYFDQTANSGDAADDADPDKDGLVNLIERAFNLHPLQPGRPVLTAVGGTGGLPLVTVLGEGGNRRLRVEYLRRKADSLPGLTYAPQFSTMLGEDWTPAAGETVNSINDLWERVTVDDAPGAVRSFGRVKVTSP